MSDIGPENEIAKDKLILLYVFDIMNMPVDNTSLTTFILKNRLMNYFVMQQLLIDLEKTKLVHCNISDEKIVYSISERGAEILNFFSNRIPQALKNQIVELATPEKKDIKTKHRVRAEYFPVGKNKYVVSCKINEDNFNLIKIELAVGTKKDSRKMCKNFKQNCSHIYTEVIDSLLKARNNSKED